MKGEKTQSTYIFLATNWNSSIKSSNLEIFPLHNLVDLGHFYILKVLCIDQNHIFEVEIWQNLTQKKHWSRHMNSQFVAPLLLLPRLLLIKYWHATFWKRKNIIFISSLFWCLIHISQTSLELFFELWRNVKQKSSNSNVPSFVNLPMLHILENMREVENSQDVWKLSQKVTFFFILCWCLLNMHFGPFNTPLSQVQMQQFVYLAISYGCLLLTL
jgi:hypothetical protein